MIISTFYYSLTVHESIEISLRNDAVCNGVFSFNIPTI